ncbi:MAG: OsmC family protein [candidate division WOR-3 bacterium]
MSKVLIKWTDGLRFLASTPSGHAVVMDTKREVGGFETAPSPMELLLVALGGCTSIDVISILHKMREEIRDYRLEIEAERASEHPKYYTKINLKYIFYGKNLKEENIRKAIELSQNKYCSVSANLSGKSQITYSYEIVEVQE